MISKEKKTSNIFEILRRIGYVLLGIYITLSLLNVFNIIEIERLGILLIIGYTLIVIELLPLTISFIRLKNKSITPNFIWLLIIFFLGISAGAGYIMWTNPMRWDDYNPDFGGLIGGLLAGTATLTVVIFSLNTDRRRAVQKARTSAEILSEILSSIGIQISRIQKGSKEMINFPANWLEYYKDVKVISENRYFDTLLKEFNYIDRINLRIKENDLHSAKKIIEERRNYYRRSTALWNIYDLELNLLNLSLGFKESSSWYLNKDTDRLIKDMKLKMSKPVEDYIYDYLEKNGNTDLSAIETELVSLIMDKYEAESYIPERIIIKALIEICCEFKSTSSRIDFVWNNFSIKSPKDTSD